MSLKKSLWVFAGVSTFSWILWLLRLLNVLGSEFDIVISWISTISLILCGVFIGLLISEKRIQARWKFAPLLLFIAGFLAFPFVGVGVLMFVETFSLSRGIEPVIFGGTITVYLLLYMGFWFWLKKKGILKFRDFSER
jgi:hypothetical protein